MYETSKTVERIKIVAKQQGITIKTMLEDCALSKNALSSMQSRGSWLQSNNLAKIADYLNVSVDYLLGRTNNPQIEGNYISTGNITGDNNANMNINTQKPEDNSEKLDEMTAELTKRFNDLSFDKKLDVFNYMKKLSQ